MSDSLELKKKLEETTSQLERHKRAHKKYQKILQRQEEQMNELHEKQEAEFDRYQKKYDTSLEKLTSRQETDLNELREKHERELGRLEKEFHDVFDVEEDSNDDEEEDKAEV